VIILKGDTKLNNKSNITLSVDSPILDELRKQAELDGLSVNAKINQILLRYSMFYSQAEKQESVILPQKDFHSILEDISENKLVENLKQNSLDLIPGIFLERGVPLTFDNVIKIVFEMIGRFSGIYSTFTHRKEKDGSTMLVFSHKYDLKWSRVLAATFYHFIKVHLNLDSEYSVMPSTITLKVFKTRSV